MIFSVFVFLVVIVLGMFIAIGLESPWIQMAKLIASHVETEARFGTSVAIDGSTVVIGAWRDDSSDFTDAGAAYVFMHDGTSWSESAKLVAPDADDIDYFGISVAIDGSTVVVGASADDHNIFTLAGAAHVFAHDGTSWVHEAKLMASDAKSGARFGNSVAIDGSTVVVGAELDDPRGFTDAGAAYVFMHDGTSWSESAKLVASSLQARVEFGTSVAIDGSTVVVGAKYDGASGVTNAGAAYIFAHDGTSWSEKTILVGLPAEEGAYFGASVAIDGPTVVVGAPYDNPRDIHDAGAAYVFVHTGISWSMEAKLVAYNAEESASLGISLSIDGSTVVVGALYDNQRDIHDAGAAYVFVHDGVSWEEETILLASDAVTGDNFGRSVAVNGSIVVVGAPSHDANDHLNSGVAYLYSIESPTSKPSSEPSPDPSSDPSSLPSYEPSALPSSLPSYEPSALPSSLPSYEPSALPSSLPSHHPSYAPRTSNDDNGSATMGAGVIAGLVVGGILVVVGGAYAIKAKVSPAEDTKGLSSVVPEQPPFLEQGCMSEAETEELHRDRGGRVQAKKAKKTKAQKTKMIEKQTKTMTAKVKSRSKASEPI